MLYSTKKPITISIVAVIALLLFAFGLSYPAALRVRGDAYTYLKIAGQFPDFSAVLAFAGDRTVGLPLFEFLIDKIVSVFTLDMLVWVNAIGIALLVTHIATAWLFSRWARSTNLVQTENMALAMFAFFATYPALIGHTTSPLTDTLAIDLVICAIAAMQAALTAGNAYSVLLLAELSAFFFGFSILVRPGNQLAVAAVLIAGITLSITFYRKTAIICAAALGCAIVLAPYYYNCTQKYGSVCLQSPETYNAVASAQAGLRGARTLWQKGNSVPGQIPTLPDDVMSANYYQRCQLKTIVGTDSSSLTGCLITRPLALPAYVVKKWIGLFDHFRFTPYLEEATPFWLRWLSRAYDSLAWMGLALFFLMLFQATKRAYRPEIREKLTHTITPVLLVVYSAVMLAQHTMLHVEDRYGFPVIPLCVVTLAIYGEKSIRIFRTQGYQKLLLPLALYCIVAATIFIAQIITWDNAVFYY
jgi:hypothetical protein